MGFKDKKGITVASGFKLQAAALLDARGQVKTIAERDELVTLNAVTPGLRVYVEETKTSYVYNGSGWDELTKGAGYTHPNTPGNKHIPAGGVSGQVLGWSADGQAKWVEDKDTTYNPATTGTNGLMSAADKAKLEGVAEGANNYTHPEHHPATVITEDDNHQFVTKAQKEAIDNMPSIGFGREYPQEAAPNSLFFLIG